MQSAPAPPKKSSKKRKLIPLLSALLILAYVGYAVTRPLPSLTPIRASGQLQITTKPSNLPWPGYGEGGVGLVGSGVIATNGDQTPTPIASTAKVLTALTVLQKHPLQANQSGPTITLSAADVGFYNSYVAVGGSVVPVQAGEQITERQVLEAMLLPSANNMADTLANWAFGSLSAYKAAATQYATQIGLTDTQVGIDASGFSPTTTSTATDLVKLGIVAIQNPAIAQIVAEHSAMIPVAGSISNRNTLLGINGIVGIKTGNSDQDPGVFLGADVTNVNGVTTTIVTAETGAYSLPGALENSQSLINAARNNFASTTLVQAGEVLGTYKQPWGGLLQAVTSKNLAVTVLQGQTAKGNFSLQTITNKTVKGQTIGTLNADESNYSAAQSVPITLAQNPTKPGLAWRLLHAF